jgi:hypothetical protein
MRGGCPHPVGTNAMSTALLVALAAVAADPLVSGLQVGQRPGPYASLVAVGPQRGTSHCFICETADRPMVIVFARRPSDAVGKLVRALDRELLSHKATELRAWVTFVSDDQPALDPQVVKWAKDQAIKIVTLAIFEDVGGPPSYRLHRDAEVTVLLAVKQKVVQNFAFRSGELTDERIAAVLKAVPALSEANRRTSASPVSPP